MPSAGDRLGRSAPEPKRSHTLRRLSETRRYCSSTKRPLATRPRLRAAHCRNRQEQRRSRRHVTVRRCSLAEASVSKPRQRAPAWDDERERRVTLLLLGKGAVLARCLVRPLAAELDEFEQPRRDAGRRAAAPESGYR